MQCHPDAAHVEGSMMTAQQRKAMLFIEAEVVRGGIAPTVKELAAHMRYRSMNHAHKLLLGLEERGFIRRLPHRARAIEVLKPVSRFAYLRFDETAKELRPCAFPQKETAQR
jgi:repressor LexA